MRALRSWLSVAPGVEVRLYGHADGAEEACNEIGVMYVPEVEVSPSGIPYFNSIVKHADRYAAYDIQVFLNCDIILTSSIARAVQAVPFPRFLMAGQRVDLPEGVGITPNGCDWLTSVHDLARRGQASLHPPSGKDYFVFPRGLWEGMPPAVIGRAGYDDALLAFCLRREIPIVDATFDIVALHQGHNYAHVPGDRLEVWQGPDAMLNARSHRGILRAAPLISDAQWTLRGGRLHRTSARGDRLRNAELYLRFVKDWEIAGYCIRALWRLLTKLKSRRRAEVGLEEVLDAYRQIPHAVEDAATNPAEAVKGVQ